MPYKIVKRYKSNGTIFYKLLKLKENKFAKPNFKTKQNAINQAKNWMRYRKEKPYVKGNYILSRN